MPSTDLSQLEADALLEMPKYIADEKRYDLPTFGGRMEVPLRSGGAREAFVLDVSQRSITLAYKYQMRARGSVVLARLDFARPHRNPDGEEVGVPHLHRYREGFGDRWASPVPDGLLSEPSNGMRCLVDFMDYCHVVERPHVDGGLYA